MGYSYTLNGQNFGASGNAPLPAGAVLTSGRPDTASEIKAKTIGGGSLPTGTSIGIDSQGNYTAGGQTYSQNNPNVVIPATSINNTPAINIPNAPTSVNLGNLISSNNTKLAGILSSSGITQDSNGLFNTSGTNTSGTASRMNTLAQTLSLMPKKDNLYSNPDIVNQNNAIEQKKQTLNTLTGNLNAIVSKAQADVLSVTGQGRGIPEAIIGGQQAQINKEAAIAALPVQAQIAVAQGDLQMAQEHLDTLIKIKSEDINNDYNYKMSVYSSIKDFVNKEQDIQLEAQKTAETRAYNEKMDNLKQIDSWQQTASKTGQGYLISSFAKLDPASPTFKSDISNIISKVQDPSVKLDLEMKKAEIAYKQEQTRQLKEPTKEEKKATTAALKEATSAVPVMQDKIKAIDAVMNSDALSSRVGTNLASRTPTGITDTLVKATSIVGIPTLINDAVQGVTGQGQDFAGGVHKLVSGLTLQSLIDAKARGATFGALSQGELSILANSASAINDWEIKDNNGKGIGVWNIDENSFKKELSSIKELTNRALLLSQGNILDQSEKSLLDNAYAPQNLITTPNSYFNQ
jgi:hypothetical protein